MALRTHDDFFIRTRRFSASFLLPILIIPSVDSYS
jgi:hypothetical protein